MGSVADAGDFARGDVEVAIELGVSGVELAVDKRRLGRNMERLMNYLGLKLIITKEDSN